VKGGQFLTFDHKRKLVFRGTRKKILRMLQTTTRRRYDVKGVHPPFTGPKKLRHRKGCRIRSVRRNPWESGEVDTIRLGNQTKQSFRDSFSALPQEPEHLGHHGEKGTLPAVGRGEKKRPAKSLEGLRLKPLPKGDERDFRYGPIKSKYK